MRRRGHEAARWLRGGKAHSGGYNGRLRLNFPTEAEAAATPTRSLLTRGGGRRAMVAQAAQGSPPRAGVGWRKKQRRWAAQIYHEGWHQHLGLFMEEAEAARVFDEAARRLRGDEARRASQQQFTVAAQPPGGRGRGGCPHRRRGPAY